MLGYQGYGAANILQEILTIKSDDITGRTQEDEVEAFENMMKDRYAELEKLE
jgi:DNA-directed RNA polymerase beta subunit